MAAAVSSFPVGALPAYKQIPETAHELDWANLVTLDLSKFDQPGGKEALANQLFKALQEVGFFYIVNFGLSQEDVDKQFAIGKNLFELPTEEKLKYRADLENGGYNGYKPLGLREVTPGIFDNTEIFNIPKFIPELDRPQPSIEKFARHIHHNVVQKLLALFAIILELPEDHFSHFHRYDALSDCHLRYMKYHARDAETNARLNNVWVKGHTDFGSLTLLFRQPVAALQVRGQDGGWKWFLTNGFLRSSIHRVVAPPADQAHVDRLGVLYFVRPEDKLELRPVQSKVLERLNYRPDPDAQLAEGITAGEWVKARVRAGVNRSKTARSELAEEDILKGVKARYYD
uniref:Non-haem dioxygenase N-terminal domain-containing protein n=1 Tax=Bionectria ochroleuca TaxID=29856 RepID=A0A8H7TT03_BIOOC